MRTLSPKIRYRVTAGAGSKIEEQAQVHKPSKFSPLETSLEIQLGASGIIPQFRQFKFHPKRRWRSDFAWQYKKLLVEVDGGSYMPKSGHTNVAGFERDREKDAEALLLGYRVLRVTSKMIKNGAALNYIKELLK